MAVLDRRDRRSSSEMRGTEGTIGWATAPMHMHFVPWLDDEAILPAQAVKLSIDANITITIMRESATINEIIHCLLSYAQAFKENNGVHFRNIRIVDIAEDLLSSNFLAISSKETYVCYIRGSKMLIKHKDEL